MRRGLVLPVILLVVALLVLIGGAMVTMGTGGLSAARSDLNSESALYAAEAGLANATTSLYATSTVPQPLVGNVGDSTWSVLFLDNPGGQPMTVPGEGITIPAQSMLMRSTGTCRQGTSRQSWALFRSGLGNFQVGVLADNFYGNNATFDAYDSGSGQSQYGAALLATNQNMGQRYSLLNTPVMGSIFVGPGGDTSATNTMIVTNNSTLQRASTMTQKITVPTITVPQIPVAAPPQAGPSPAATPVPVLWVDPAVNPAGQECTVAPPSNPSNPVTIRKDCLTVNIWASGVYTASEGGSGCQVQGNWQDQSFSVVNPPGAGCNTIQVTYNPFTVTGNWHRCIIDPSTQQYGSDPAGIVTPPPAAVYAAAPQWLFDFMTPAPSVVNPPTLPPGRYQAVQIDSASSTLQENSTYVIKDLTVTQAGQIHLLQGAGNVSIYVTGSLTLDGKDTLLNETKKPPLMKIYYTGTQDVIVSGGSQAYATLMAPTAAIKLNGYNADYSGALVGTSLNVTNANFHYDTATNGVGTGTDGTTLTLLARYRP